MTVFCPVCSQPLLAEEKKIRKNQQNLSMYIEIRHPIKTPYFVYQLLLALLHKLLYRKSTTKKGL